MKSAIERGNAVWAALDDSGSRFATGENTSLQRWERAGDSMESNITATVGLVVIPALPSGLALVSLFCANPPTLQAK